MPVALTILGQAVDAETFVRVWTIRDTICGSPRLSLLKNAATG
jgi:hypothetical protein